jgi:hypothetical protein
MTADPASGGSPRSQPRDPSRAVGRTPYKAEPEHINHWTNPNARPGRWRPLLSHAEGTQLRPPIGSRPGVSLPSRTLAFGSARANPGPGRRGVPALRGTRDRRRFRGGFRVREAARPSRRLGAGPPPPQLRHAAPTARKFAASAVITNAADTRSRSAAAPGPMRPRRATRARCRCWCKPEVSNAPPRTTAGSERQQPRRPTRRRLPVRPGDAALWRRRPRPPSTVSHELLSSKHKSSSLAGTARTVRPDKGSRASAGAHPAPQRAIRIVAHGARGTAPARSPRRRSARRPDAGDMAEEAIVGASGRRHEPSSGR